jgi:hypothetical protein
VGYGKLLEGIVQDQRGLNYLRAPSTAPGARFWRSSTTFWTLPRLSPAALS